MRQAFDPCDAIAAHAAGTAEAVAGILDAPVEHCLPWTVADLLRHLVDVHWFWATIVDERLDAPPAESRRPAPPDDASVVAAFQAGAERLVRVLRGAPAEAPVWTWAPGHHDIGFVRRHQVQEAAVHRWDAVHAGGGTFEIPSPEAADAVDEFLAVSVSSDLDPATPPRPPLDGRIALEATDTGTGWTLSDGDAPGTIRVTAGKEDGVPAVTATSSDLLLWLYGRVPVASGADPALLGRFRALCFTS